MVKRKRIRISGPIRCQGMTKSMEEYGGALRSIEKHQGASRSVKEH